MRRWETALAGALMVVAGVMVFAAPERTVALALGAVLLVLAVTHLIIERWRWQMVPVYLAGAGTVAILVLTGRSFGWFALVLLGACVVLVVAGVLLSVALPVPSVRQPSGPYPVGTTVRHLDGRDRPEIHSANDADRRELMLQVWYPSADSDRERARYLPHAAIGGRELTKAFDMPQFLLGHLGLVESYARVDPDLAALEHPLPVLLFSHGRGGTRIQNTYQAEELASHGYVVAAVDHAYGSGYTVYPDGRIIQYDQSIFGDDSPAEAGVVINEWAKDLGWVLDTLAEANSNSGGRFGGRLDLGRVGGFGHSAGAGAMIELAYRDPRCGPVVAYDPWVVPVSDEAIEAGIPRPLLVLKQPESLGPINAERLSAIMDSAVDGSDQVEIADTKHLDFNDFKLLLPAMRLIGMTGSINADRLQATLNQRTLEFLDAHLGEPGLGDG